MNQNDQIFTFGVSTDEDLRFRLTFQNHSFTGRTLSVLIRERDTNTLKVTLSQPSQILVATSGIPGLSNNDVVVSLAKSSMSGWVRGEYEADLIDVTSGISLRVVPVRFVLDNPGNLVYGVEGNQADITISDDNQAIVTAIGGLGIQGDKGDQGDKGWSPILAVVVDGVRRVHQVVDWTGGAGTKPAVGQYVGPTGLVTPIASATDLRGPVGPSGSVVDGVKGDITVSASGTSWTVNGGYVPLGGGTYVGLVRVNHPDDGNTALLLNGLTNGIRFIPQVGGSAIEGVDKTGNISYQPLSIRGSSLAFAGPATFDSRPMFGANTPWDSGNFDPAAKIDKIGGTMTGSLIRSGPTSSNRSIFFATSGSTRWEIGADASSEAGGNAGSTFGVYRYSDAGAYLNSPFYILRTTGQSVFSVRPSWGASLTPWDTGNFNPGSYATLASPTFSGVATGYRFRALAYDVEDATAGANLKIGRWLTGGGSTKFEVLNDAYNAVLYTPITINHGTGQVQFPTRPAFGANTPWDSGNLGSFVGDAGSGGSPGLIPAPAAGDAAAGKVLGAGGGWVTPSAGVSVPQGRLTLSSGVSVMSAAVAGGATVFYTPHGGQSVPLYDGTRTAMRDLGGELAQALTDTTKSPAAAAANANYDMFVWLDGATARCTRGPAWANGTDPGTGAGTTELELVNGFWVNRYAITNGPAARRGLYVGSIRTNISAQVDWSTGSGATGGGIANLTIWNAYNQVEHMIMVRDTTASWTYGSASYRSMNGSNTNRINLLAGRGVGSIRAEVQARITNAGGFGVVDIALDSTTIPAVGSVRDSKALTDSVSRSLYCGRVGPGFHYLQALEVASGAQNYYAGGDQQALSAVWVA